MSCMTGLYSRELMQAHILKERDRGSDGTDRLKAGQQLRQGRGNGDDPCSCWSPSMSAAVGI